MEGFKAYSAIFGTQFTKKKKNEAGEEHLHGNCYSVSDNRKFYREFSIPFNITINR